MSKILILCIVPMYKEQAPGLPDDVPEATVFAADRDAEQHRAAATVRSWPELFRRPFQTVPGLPGLDPGDRQAVHVFQLRQGLHPHLHAEPPPSDRLRKDQKHQRQVEVSPLHPVLRHRGQPGTPRAIRVRRTPKVLLHLLQPEVHSTMQPDQTPAQLPQRELRQQQQRRCAGRVPADDKPVPRRGQDPRRQQITYLRTRRSAPEIRGRRSRFVHRRLFLGTWIR